MPDSDKEGTNQPAPFEEVEDWASSSSPNFTDMHEPPPRKRYWPYALLACVITTVTYAIVVRSPTDANKTATLLSSPGWDDLVPCSDATSLDGMKTLTLLQNRRAILNKTEDGKDRTVEGHWSFDQNPKQYAVTLDGMTKTYSIASLPSASAGICMLVAGDLNAANLHESWFAAPNDDPDDRELPDRY